MVRHSVFCGCFGGCFPDLQADDEVKESPSSVSDEAERQPETASDFRREAHERLRQSPVQRSRWGLGCPCRSRAAPSIDRGIQPSVARRTKRTSLPFSSSLAQSSTLVAEWKIVAATLHEDELEKLHDMFNFVEQMGLPDHPSNTVEQPHARKASTLLRFLRARDGDVCKAAGLLKEALDWRHEFDLDSKLKAFRREMTQGTSRRATLLRMYGYVERCATDLVGHPVHVQRFSQGDPGGLVRELGDESVLLYLLSMIEASFDEAHQQMLLSGQFVCGFVEIVDVGNYGLVGGWYQRAMSAIGPYSKFAPVFDKVYPERVRAMFIFAPKAFALIWRLALPFVPQATRGKIRMKGQASHTWVSELSEFMSMDDVPKFLKEDDPANYPLATPYGGFVPKDALVELQDCSGGSALDDVLRNETVDADGCRQ